MSHRRSIVMDLFERPFFDEADDATDDAEDIQDTGDDPAEPTVAEPTA